MPFHMFSPEPKERVHAHIQAPLGFLQEEEHQDETKHNTHTDNRPPQSNAPWENRLVI